MHKQQSKHARSLSHRRFSLARAPSRTRHRPILRSLWNEANLFTGWADVELTTLGKNEAAGGATQMWREGLKFDVAYTSRLKRAQQTLDIVLRITGQEDVQVHRCWRLNERMYGALTGLNKKETVAKYGEEQVKQWRRSYSTPPPEIDTSSEYWPGNANECECTRGPLGLPAWSSGRAWMCPVLSARVVRRTPRTDPLLARAVAQMRTSRRTTYRSLSASRTASNALCPTGSPISFPRSNAARRC